MQKYIVIVKCLAFVSFVNASSELDGADEVSTSKPSTTSTPPPNYCNSSPCRNGATCINEKSTYACVCPPGLTGKRCDIHIDYCGKGHHITCPEGDIFQCVNRFGGAFCDCPPGYYLWNGTCHMSEVVALASIELKDAVFESSLYDPTSKEFNELATAINTTLVKNVKQNNKSDIYSARIQSFSTTGTQLTIFANTYLTVTTLDNTTFPSAKDVEVNLTSYLTTCSKASTACFPTSGSSANASLKSFMQVLPCEAVCPEDTVCVESSNATSGLACICAHGYNWMGSIAKFGEIDVQICTDLNECGILTQPCGFGNCYNIPGSYMCECADGYVWNDTEKSCIASSACNSSPCKHGGACNPHSANVYSCECTWLYAGEQCDDYVPLALFVLTVIFAVIIIVLLSLMVGCWLFGGNRKRKGDETATNDYDESGGTVLYSSGVRTAPTYGARNSLHDSAPQWGMYNNPDVLKWANSTTPMTQEEFRLDGMISPDSGGAAPRKSFLSFGKTKKHSTKQDRGSDAGTAASEDNSGLLPIYNFDNPVPTYTGQLGIGGPHAQMRPSRNLSSFYDSRVENAGQNRASGRNRSHRRSRKRPSHVVSPVQELHSRPDTQRGAVPYDSSGYIPRDRPIYF